MRLRYWAVLIFFMPYLAVPIFLYNNQRYQKLLKNELIGWEKNLAIVGIIWFLAFLFAFLSSPNNVGTSSPSSNLASSQKIEVTPMAKTTASPQKISAFGQTVKVGDLEIVFSNLRREKTVSKNIFSDETARDGAIFVIFDAQAYNAGKKSDSLSELQMKMIDDLGREFDLAGGNEESGRFASAIEPGLSATYLAFYAEVPETAKGLKLKVVDNIFLASEQVFVAVD